MQRTRGPMPSASESKNFFFMQSAPNPGDPSPGAVATHYKERRARNSKAAAWKKPSCLPRGNKRTRAPEKTWADADLIFFFGRHRNVAELLVADFAVLLDAL